jgi:hypothetical protein
MLLAVLARPIAHVFDAQGETAELIVFFCRVLAPLFVFLGALFVANAAFNTLGRPHLSTALNWGRATLGTIPFAALGGYLAAAPGVLTGSMLGGVSSACSLCGSPIVGSMRWEGPSDASRPAPKRFRKWRNLACISRARLWRQRQPNAIARFSRLGHFGETLGRDLLSS